MNEARRRRRRWDRRCSTRCSGWRSGGGARRCSTWSRTRRPTTYLAPAPDARRRRGEPAAAGAPPASTRSSSTPASCPSELTLAGRARGAVPAARAHEVVRLEAVAEDGAGRRAPGARRSPTRCVARLALEPGRVGAKSIAAYRVGLRLPGAPPDRRRSWSRRALGRRRRRLPRLADPVVQRLARLDRRRRWGCRCSSTSGTATATSTCSDCDPLQLTPFLRATAERGRAGAAAAQLPVPPPRGLPRPGLRPRLHGRRPGHAQHRRAVGGACCARRSSWRRSASCCSPPTPSGSPSSTTSARCCSGAGWARVLGALVDDGELTAADAAHVAALVARENARRAYGLR